MQAPTSNIQLPISDLPGVITSSQDPLCITGDQLGICGFDRTRIGCPFEGAPVDGEVPTEVIDPYVQRSAGLDTDPDWKTRVNDVSFGCWYAYARHAERGSFVFTQQSNVLHAADIVSLPGDRLRIGVGLRAAMPQRGSTNLIPGADCTLFRDCVEPLPQSDVSDPLGQPDRICADSIIDNTHDDGSDFLPVAGRIAVDSPRWTGAIGLNHDNGHWFGNVDIRDVDRQFSAFMDDQSLPACAVADLGTGYRPDGIGSARHPRIQLNVSNLADDSDLSGIAGVTGNANATRGVSGTTIAGSAPYYVGGDMALIVSMSSAS